MKNDGLIAAPAAVFFLFVSCASVPKSQSAPQSTQIPRNEQKTAAEPVSYEQLSAEQKKKSGTKDDYNDLSEPVVPDNLPDSVPVHSLPGQNSAQPGDNEISEPVVYDEVHEEKSAKQNPKDSSVSDIQSAQVQPAEQISKSEQKDVSAKSDEITPVKRAAAVQQDSAAITHRSPHKTSSVQKKETADSPVKSQKGQTSDRIEKAVSENLTPSRSVTLSKNQYLDVEYPGTGWIYLGETNGTKNMIFFGRKLGDTDTSFTLHARSTGKSILHFYKNDILTGKYIDDYLEVNVTGNADSAQKHINAPLYADIVPPNPSSTITKPVDNVTSVQTGSKETTPLKSEKTNQDIQNTADSQNKEIQPANTVLPGETPVKTIIQTTESTPDSQAHTASPSTLSAGSIVPDQSGETAAVSTTSTDSSSGSVVQNEQTQNESSDDLLKDAQNAYNANQYEKALALLTLFFNKAVTRIDEGLYLQGQVLEAKSSIQNIKDAVDSYEILMKNWPDSTLWQNARQRDIYLHRMYIDIR
ncbi:MAG: hypothetical protein WCR31_07280 [Treponema sp.]